MEFRELFVWVAVMAARATRKEGSCWKERHTCGGQEPRCLEEVDPVFRLITSDEAARSAFRPNKGPATINHPTGSLRGCWIRRSRDHWIGIQFQCLLDEIIVTRRVLRGISFALSVRLCMTLFYSRLWQRFFSFLSDRSRNFCLFDESRLTLRLIRLVEFDRLAVCGVVLQRFARVLERSRLRFLFVPTDFGLLVYLMSVEFTDSFCKFYKV